jgi:hypothetical protein
MRKLFWILSLVSFGIAALWSGTPGHAQTPSATTAATATTANVIFSDDFSTRANRWATFDLGKAKIDFDDTVSPSTLKLSALIPNYPLWTVPDTDLKLPRFDMQADLMLSDGDDSATAGIMLQYFSEADITAFVITRRGEAHLGHLSYGIWKDLVPPIRVTIDPAKPITLEAILDSDHTLRLFANDQAAGGTTLANFKAAGFGLFAMTGKTGGIAASFQRFAITDIQAATATP